MDFDLRFVHSFILEIIVVSHFDIVNVVKDWVKNKQSVLPRTNDLKHKGFNASL